MPHTGLVLLLLCWPGLGSSAPGQSHLDRGLLESGLWDDDQEEGAWESLSLEDALDQDSPDERRPEEWARYEAGEDELLVEGDIIVPLLDGAADRKVLVDHLWPLGVPVPFAISNSSEPFRAKILAGIEHIMEHTCVTFLEVPESFTGAPHLRYRKASGCTSYVGRQKRMLKGQWISIGAGCGGLVTVVHETSHALGFFHEQSRQDRDEHLEIVWDNIKKGREPNFNKKPKADALNIPYDFTSVMHYGSYFFSKNGLPTMRAWDPLEEHLVGRRPPHLTHRDKAMYNKAYSCTAHCLSPPQCLNEGYVDKFCSCVCPDGISGDLCENKPEDYRYYGPICGDVNITTAGTITSVDYPANMATNQNCFWLVTAPADQEVHLTFTEVTMNLYPKCSRDRMTVRVQGDLRDADTTGCGTELTGREFTSSGGRLLFTYRTRGGSRRKRRFTAEVAFVPAV